MLVYRIKTKLHIAQVAHGLGLGLGVRVRVRVRVYDTTELCALYDAHLHKGLHVLVYRIKTKLHIAQVAHGLG